MQTGFLQQFIDYFSDLENRPIERMAFLVGGLLFFWIIEGAIPLLTLNYKKTKFKHALTNLGFTLMHLLIHTALAIFIVMLSDWCKAQGFGLVYWFNVVHHADNNVDATTGLRHHPVESVLRGVFFFMAIFISGAPIYVVMIYQTVLILAAAFTHANISLPKWLDNGMSYILVSPNMHKVHHHWKQPYTDSNYGVIFSIWDRLFGTFKKLDPTSIRYGLDRYYPNEKDEDFINLMKKPFQKLDA